MHKCIKIAFFITAIFVFIFACRKPKDTPSDANAEWLQGGKQTLFISGAGAFSQAFPVLSEQEDLVHERGDVLFSAVYNSDPSQVFFGLGPIFNNVSCVSCHIGDGRGKAPIAGEALSSALIRLSIPGKDPHGGPNPVPGFGGQLQQRGIFGAKQEADVAVSYIENAYQFSDGTPYNLRTPKYELFNAYLSLPSNVMQSTRIATAVFGLGLLEAIPAETILAFADPGDLDGDGISGKANMVWDVETQKLALGRFGWKAGQPTVIQQSAGAFNQDMGVTSYIFPVESSFGQSQHAWSKGIKEVSDSDLFALAFYVRTLAVPARRNADDPRVILGKNLFFQVDCGKCHKQEMRTAVDVSQPAFSNQRIFPYTDLLLHDMGPGLADNRPEFEADGYEWRTPPLWGIGLTKVVNGHNNFLHDGRARNFLEAIMWHGGEAEQSKNKFAALSKSERDAILRFLESL